MVEKTDSSGGPDNYGRESGTGSTRDREAMTDEDANELMMLREQVREQTLCGYMAQLHCSLHSRLESDSNTSSHSQGHTTDPADREYPAVVERWVGFEDWDRAVWEELTGSEFSTERLFTPALVIDKLVIWSIRSEDDVKHFETTAVEDHVCAIVRRLKEFQTKHADVFQIVPRVQGSVEFRTHKGHVTSKPRPTGRREAGGSRGKRSIADRYCLFEGADGSSRPLYVIEYKVPHKFPVEDVRAGTSSGTIQTMDMFKRGEVGTGRYAFVAVLTQLYSSMMAQNQQFGYVCTGEAFIFARIARPDCLQYHVTIPAEECNGKDIRTMSRSGAGSVLLFTLRALSADDAPPNLFDGVEGRSWPSNYGDDLSDSSGGSADKADEKDPSFRGGGWSSSAKSYDTRSRVGRTGRGMSGYGDVGKEQSDHNSQRATVDVSGTIGPRIARSMALAEPVDVAYGQVAMVQANSVSGAVKYAPYCSQNCLRGLMMGWYVDETCPNACFHGARHIDVAEFLRRLVSQLASNRGRSTNCVPLHLSGATASLFKVRLASHGYTLVAKGVEQHNAGLLEKEQFAYGRLSLIQGVHVPVCLGVVHSRMPYYYDGGEFVSFLLLGWAGRRLSSVLKESTEAFARAAVVAVRDALCEIHKLGVLHGDAEPRNILYDSASRMFMISDFGQAKVIVRGDVSPACARRSGRNGGDRTRETSYMEETRKALASVYRCSGYRPDAGGWFGVEV